MGANRTNGANSTSSANTRPLAFRQFNVSFHSLKFFANGNSASAESNWQEHVDGKSNFAPPIPPLAPAKFTGSLFITSGHNAIPECTNFSLSLEDSTGTYVQTVAPNGAGTTSGMLGYMFWAAECPSTRNICTTPPNTCQGGVGVGARTYSIPLPMPALRQQ